MLASIMTLYIAGVGQTNPPLQDGQVIQPPYPQAGLPVQISYPSHDGTSANAPITYAGAAPGLAAGIWQVNFYAPSSSTAATATIQVPGSSTNFTVYTYFINPSP
jgi:uncharacterized protein (TIGR03437 family)